MKLFSRLFSKHFTLVFLPGGHANRITDYVENVKYWEVWVPVWKTKDFREIVKLFGGVDISANRYSFDSKDIMPLTEHLCSVIV